MKRYMARLSVVKTFEIEVSDDATEEDVKAVVAGKETDYYADSIDTTLTLVDEDGNEICDCCGELMEGGFCPNVDCGCYT